jgi:hypothetical protein
VASDTWRGRGTRTSSRRIPRILRELMDPSPSHRAFVAAWPDAAPPPAAAWPLIGRDEAVRELADRRRIDRDIAAARAREDEEAWRGAWAEGEQMAFDAAIDRARAARGSAAPASRAAGRVAV